MLCRGCDSPLRHHACRGSSAVFASQPSFAPTQRKGLRVVAQAAAAVAAEPPSTAATNQYQLFTLTTWLLDQEKQGNIDVELATVISSIALACKQIGSLVSRAGISNLTGA